MKNYRITMVLLGTLFFSQCSQNVSNQNDLPPIQEVFDSFYDGFAKSNPVWSTFMGIHDYNHLFNNDIAKEERDRILKFYQDHLERIKQYDYNSLSIMDQTNYDVLVWACNEIPNGWYDPVLSSFPIDQLGSWVQYMPVLGSGSSAQPFNSVEDYNNWLSRLDGYLVWFDSAEMVMRKGMQDGYVLPKKIVSKIIPQIESFASATVEESTFYLPVKNFPDSLSDESRRMLTEKFASVISDQIIPRYKRMAEFLREEYLAAARETSGIGSLPEGKESYERLVRFHTSSDLEPDSIFNLGQAEVDRIAGEMSQVIDQVGFKGSLTEFLAHIRTKRELMPYTDPQQVIDKFNSIHEKMKPNLDRLFKVKPETSFEVRRTEKFREKSASAQYFPGSIDGTKPGIFYVPIPDVTSYNVLYDEVLFLHEAIPGHHYQIMLDIENDSIASFRKLLIINAFAEGWGLYTESLGKELGLYEDPYQYFGMLSAEMHRAIRLVVDVGIHHKGWTREEAIEYSEKYEVSSSSMNLESEIERYMVIPGQALSYKIGQLTIRRLRTEAEEALGERFDIREFHHQVLKDGSIPLSVLEKKIRAWIAVESGEQLVQAE